jgi:hypothetical protein
MPNNNLDPPKEALASLDNTAAALQAAGNAMTCGRGTSALRAMFGACDADRKSADPPQNGTKQSLQRTRPGLSALTPRI